MASKRKGLSNTALVQNALMSISRVDRYQNKWMPDSKWVELIKSAYGDIEEPYEALTAADLNTAISRNRFLADSMDGTAFGNQWGLFRHKKHNGTRNVICYIAVEKDTPVFIEHQNPIRLFADEVKLFADEVKLFADTVESTVESPS